MDFYTVKERPGKKDIIEIYPDFKVVRSKDLMVQGRSFYAVWDAEENLWSTDEYDVCRLVDQDLWRYVDENSSNDIYVVKTMNDFSTGSWKNFRQYLNNISDSYHVLDETLTFKNTEVRKEDYASKRLPYSLEKGDHSAWDELVDVLYEPEERAKIEWAIGAIIAGDAKDIQKFLVLYGSAGTGKSTILNIIQKLFAGYYTSFEAKALTSNNNSFATEVFRNNPLVAIQHDGDLSRIEDNTKLNSIVSHEEMTMNEKYKPSYTARINAFLFMGTNKPVKITDAKSGIIRRLIDVQPTGDRVSPKTYQALMGQIEFQFGAIAQHCLETYFEMGKDYYNGYRPIEMMLQTDIFYNFVEDNYEFFKSNDGTTLNQAYLLYKRYCDEASVEYRTPKFKFREELKNYFKHFDDRSVVKGERVHSYYSGFINDRFTSKKGDDSVYSLVLDRTESIFDRDFAEAPAQYATDSGTPQKRWAEVTSVLSDISTNSVHYVKPGEQHIVIDFDLRDETGEKSPQLNLEAASKWPKTYAEFSKSGGGIHLHYNYTGDVSELAREYSPGVEIKIFKGDAALRRKLTLCNNHDISSLSDGLPLKEKKVIDADAVKSEKGLRDLIERNLRKEIHPSTKSSMDFIKKILDDAYKSDLAYDVTNMRPRILAFANNSTNQAMYCLKLVQSMEFASEAKDEPSQEPDISPESDRLVFFDVEVFPNLFVVCWKYEESDNIVKMINPSSEQIENLVKYKLVGFNCRRYDNHILYGAMLGYNNDQLYKLSQKIINNGPNALFREAYNLSYTDIYDFSSKKQSLKKFEIELGITHIENHFPWDKELDEENWPKVVEYCANDVLATEATFEARKDDFIARSILADLSGLSHNHTTQQHTAKIIFEGDRNASEQFVYTHLDEMFPGYSYERGKSTYRDEEVGEGGYVYAEPGMYENVALLDVASMHPTSIEQLDLFGPYTKNFSDLKSARIAIKHGDYESARQMLEGKLAPYLEDDSNAEALSYALKIVINIVYGLTSAKFDNPFRDVRNKDNIVAKRGALFMIDLKHFVQEQGYSVAHIKTDSIKIPNADKEIIDAVMEFGNKYGYSFEHEETYEKICLVNEAVYVAKTSDGRKPSHWSAVGAQFQHPYVFKRLFSHEEIEFKDLCETKSVKTALYLDFNSDDKAMGLETPLHFVGKIGQFVPVTRDGGLLLRESDGKYYAVTGTKGYRWKEASMVESLGKDADIDISYFDKLVEAAENNLAKYGDVTSFLE